MQQENAAEAAQTHATEQQNKRYLRPREIAAYVLNTTAHRSMASFVDNSKQFFLMNFWGITGAQFGTISFFTSIWDALDDPLSGAILDRARTRWGRLRPFLLAPIPLWAITTIAFFVIPWFIPQNYRLAWALGVNILNSIGLSYANGSKDILLYNMTPNSAERTSLITTQKFVELVAVWIPSFIPIAFDFLPKVAGVRQQSIYGGFAVFFVIVAIAASLFAFFRIRERVPLSSRETASEVSLFQSLKNIALNRPLLALLLSTFFQDIKGIGGASESFFWLNNTGRLTNGTIAGLFTGIPNYFLTPIAPKLIRRFDARNVAIYAGIFGGAMYLTMFLIGYKPFGSMTANLIYLTAILTICGLPNTIMGVCYPVLLGDVYDYLEWKSGVRSEGLVTAVSGYITKLSKSFIGLMQGMLLAMIHYTPLKDSLGNLVPQTDAKMLLGIFAIFALAPSVARFGYGFSMILFNVHGGFRDKMLNELAERRAAQLAEMTRKEAAE